MTPDTGPVDTAGRDGQQNEGGAGNGDSDSGPAIPPECGSLEGCSPGCPERCNGKDDDCDVRVDEDSTKNICKSAHATAVCDRGACLVVGCLNQYRDCDENAANGCETALGDTNNCGSCGNVCDLPNSVVACEAGQCVAASCEPGYGNCDGDTPSCETQLVSLADCGSCGVSCGGLTNASAQCDSGRCDVKRCIGNFGDCDGDAANGCESRLDTLAHCGACGTLCNKASCVGGACSAAQCSEPMADCDHDEIDCEVNLLDNSSHCGGCGLACAFDASSAQGSLSCVNGSCKAACEPSFGDCDGDYANGCEISLDTDAKHCSGCAVSCTTLLAHSAQTKCTAGGCSVVSCASGWANCDNVDSNGCEHSLTTDGACFPDTNCVKSTYLAHSYFFCNNASTWAAARSKCQLQTGGDLAAISSAGENTFIQMIRTANVWLGARDASLEGSWRWARDGMLFWRGAAAGTAQLSQYENWNNVQPDDSGGAEDCAEMLSDGSWGDTSCSGTRAFVCEVGPDECPSDSAKREAGQCGCGVADTDTDNDGFAGCIESCDADPNKQVAGTCGCGNPETDSDSDGTPDCNDDCPADPTQTTNCLPFTPSNFDPAPINWGTQPMTTLNCGTTTVNTTDPDGAGPLVATITNWCGSAPLPIAQNQSGGPQVVIIPLRSLNITTGNTLRLIGTRPVILAVDGAVTVDGTIDASASGTTAGAGGNWTCGFSQGGNGSGSSGRFNGASGGGGGGFGTAGGRAGTANTDGGNVSGGVVGVARGATTLIPLLGGCAGGQAGGCSTAGAAGGGGIQISASGAIDIGGSLRANGGAGATPCGASDEGGGTGGGSGGAILLEASSVVVTGSTIQANGGAGGKNGTYAGFYNCGGSNGGSGSSSASNAGGGGVSCQGGSSGGGGGYGRIRTLVH